MWIVVVVLWICAGSPISKAEADDMVKSLKRITTDLQTVVGILNKHLPVLEESGLSQARYLSSLSSADYQREMRKAESLAEKIELAQKVKDDENEKERTMTQNETTTTVTDPSRVSATLDSLTSFFEYGPIKYAVYFVAFIIDMVIWTSVQVFLDNIGKKKKKKKSRSRSRSRSRTPLARSSGMGRLAFLTQEDVLARYIDTYYVKVGISFLMSCCCRLPSIFLADGLLLHILTNLIITLRGLALVTFLIQDQIVV